MEIFNQNICESGNSDDSSYDANGNIVSLEEGGSRVMDKQFEALIVKNFFNKRLQERVIFELSSPKKRISALNRLSHNFKNTLDEKYLIEIPKPNSYCEEIVSLLKKYGAGKTCYAISSNKDIDGKYLPLIPALEQAIGYGLPSIISCINGDIAYFESEQESGLC